MSWDQILGSSPEDRKRLLPGIILLSVIEAIVIGVVAVVLVQRYW